MLMDLGVRPKENPQAEVQLCHVMQQSNARGELYRGSRLASWQHRVLAPAWLSSPPSPIFETEAV